MGYRALIKLAEHVVQMSVSFLSFYLLHLSVEINLFCEWSDGRIEKEMATHSRNLAWKIPRTAESPITVEVNCNNPGEEGGVDGSRAGGNVGG